MKQSIVITTIFEPTTAVKAFSQMSNYDLIIVGDKKTPSDWILDNTKFYSIEQQMNMSFKLAKHLPYNHYCRKMLGYLVAAQNKAEIIIDTDDDNIPYPDWDFPATKGLYDSINAEPGFINIYSLFSEQKIWPRGLPLNMINEKQSHPILIKVTDCNVGIWQGLADEDPDVDALYRLTGNEECFFKKRPPIVLNNGIISPFNTQNTLIIKELFPLLYLPVTVTFRFTDILRGLIAQPIMWLYGYQLGFTHATVTQKRNVHDYYKDFLSEIPMYEHSPRIVELISGKISGSKTIYENLLISYRELHKHGIVKTDEIKTLDAWLNDLSSL